MNPNSEILAKLIQEDYGLVLRDGQKWGRSEEHDSLVLDFEAGVFYWNSRSIVGDSITYLTRVRGLPFSEAVKYVKQFKNYEETFVYTVKSNNQEDIVVYPRLVDIFWRNGKSKRDYWYNRCLEDKTIDRFKLGYYNGWSLIPVILDSTFRQFQMRMEQPYKRIKNWYKGIGALPFNFDILSVSSSVVITEGVVDAILLNQYGIPTVSTIGGEGGWKEEYFKYFIDQMRIYYVEDNDQAGRKASRRVANILGLNRVKIVRFEGYDDKYDTVDWFRDGNTLDNFKDLCYNKSKFIFELE